MPAASETLFPLLGNVDVPAKWMSLLEDALTTGVVNDGTSPVLDVIADATGLQVKLQPGRAGAGGFRYINSAQVVLPVAPNTSSQTRIDRVVIEVDSRSPNSYGAIVVPGIPAVTPLPPTIAPADLPYKRWCYLRQVQVPAGAVSIPSSAVSVDERLIVRPASMRGRGEVGYAEMTTGQTVTSGTATTIITGQSTVTINGVTTTATGPVAIPGVVIPAGRRYEVRAAALLENTSAAPVLAAGLLITSATATFSYDQAPIGATTADANTHYRRFSTWRRSVSTGAPLTFGLSVVAFTGGGPVVAVAGPTYPIALQLTDLGV